MTSEGRTSPPGGRGTSQGLDGPGPGAAGRGGLLRSAMTAAVLLLAAAGLLAAGAYWHETIGGWFGLGTSGGDHQAQQSAAEGKGVLWTCGMHPQVIQDHPGTCPICHMKLTPLKADTDKTQAAKGERKVKYWWDPMLGPNSISDKPGKSAMGMELVPVYDDEISGGVTVTIDPVMVQNMGVRVAKVTRGPVRRTIRAVGILGEAEPLIHDVNLRVSGWIEKLHAATEGQHVLKGEPLFDLYSPELQVAVEELISARKAAGSLKPSDDDLAARNTQTLMQSSQMKLEQWGLDQVQIDGLAKLERAPRTITFKSPLTGHVTQKNVVEGAAVKAGDRVLRLVNHATLWLDAQVFEHDLPFIDLGQKVTATVEAVPGKEFEGEVVFIHPHVDPVTRTATVRLALPNPDLKLRPAMYATVQVAAQIAEDALLVPREAVIDTGTRNLVFVVAGEGRFEPRNIKVGSASADGNLQVLSGLAPGESVVTSGQFLLDAESRMKEAIQKHLEDGLLAKAGGMERAPAAVSDSPEKESSTPALAEKSTTKAATPAGEKFPWSPMVDAVYLCYLEISRALGATQESGAPLEVGKLVEAAKGMSDATTGPGQRLSKRVLEAAAAMRGKSLEEQRKLFKPLSEAAIAMAEACPPSKAAGAELYVAHCPMAFNTGADWLQATKTIANPYFSSEMKECGQITRTIRTGAETK